MTDPGGGASRTTDPAAGTSSATVVSLREYFNEKIAGDRTTNRDRFVALTVVGGIIWFFVERHLADLNHENARVASVTEKSVSSDTYAANEARRDDEREQRREWEKTVDSNLTQSLSRQEFQHDSKSDRRGTVDTSTKIVGAVIAAVVLGLAILNYQALHNDPAPVVIVPSETVTTPSP